MEFDWKAWFMGVWEDNRRLTDKVANALVEAGAIDQTPVAGMRPFRKMLLEIWGMEQVYVRGLAHEQWQWEALPDTLGAAPIEETLAFGRQVREETRRLWPTISFDALAKERPAPFEWHPQGRAIEWLTYSLENEIHHRGQGYVYLRLLGQEPPAFYIRTE